MLPFQVFGTAISYLKKSLVAISSRSSNHHAVILHYKTKTTHLWPTCFWYGVHPVLYYLILSFTYSWWSLFCSLIWWGVLGQLWSIRLIVHFSLLINDWYQDISKRDVQISQAYFWGKGNYPLHSLASSIRGILFYRSHMIKKIENQWQHDLILKRKRLVKVLRTFCPSCKRSSRVPHNCER